MKLFKLGLSLLVLLFIYQNCGDGFQSAFNQQQSSSSTLDSDTLDDSLEPDPVVNPAPTLPEFKVYMLPNLVPDCMNNPNYNACLFWKNPVAQRQVVLASPLTFSTNLAADQVHGVNILGTDGSGALRNATINVSTSAGTRVMAPDMDFKQAFDGTVAQGRFVTQTMVYHWMQTAITLHEMDFGGFHAKDRNITVDAILPTLNNATYRYTQNDIRMGVTPEGIPFGMSGEIAVHELGHANHRWASDFAFTANGTTACAGTNTGTCCTNKNTSCPAAFAEGVADYQYGLVFPSNTAGGESLTNNLGAPSRCGLTRNFAAHTDLTLVQSCASIYALGMMYASVWNEVRKQAEVNQPGVGEKNLNMLFTEHLTVLRNDNWQSILNKIATLDTDMFNGIYTPLFVAEMQRRQINVTAP